MDRKTPKKVDRKRFVRYKEGAEMSLNNTSSEIAGILDNTEVYPIVP